MKRMPVLFALLLSLAPAAEAAPAESSRLLRQPTVSAEHVVFAYANDLWAVARGGGEARRLTSFPGQETSPHLSPDGRTVAFTARYDGNVDVYVVPVEGGEPRRLTWHPGNDSAEGWTPDGRRVVFGSGRDSVPLFGGGPAKFWTVPLEGGFPEAMPMPRADRGMHSPDGRRFAYQPILYFDEEWRNYRGGQVRPIWILDLKSLEVETPPWDGSRDTHPAWLGDSVYFLSDRGSQIVNIYRYDTRSKQVTAVTEHADHDVKSLAAGGGVLAYEQAGYVHIYDPAGGSSRRLDITVRGDFPWARPHWEDVADSLTHASLSPSGKRALFEARGEIFSVPTDKGDWRNLTRTPGVADRWPAWSPKGDRIAWFSDEGGEYRLMIGSQDGLSEPKAIAIPEPTFYFTPAWSPDGSKLAFTDTDISLWVADVDSGEVTRIDADTWVEPERTLEPRWSPDSRWLAYSKRLDTHLHAVFIHDADGGETHRITDGLADALAPAWDAGGKYLYFLAGTDYALNIGWLDMSSYQRPIERRIYLAVLAAGEPSPLLPESDEEAVEKADDGADGKADGKKGDDRKKDAGKAGDDKAGDDKAEDDKADDKDEPKPVIIDFEGMDQRILALEPPAAAYVALEAAGEGVVFFAEVKPGQPGSILQRYALKDRKAAEFASGVQFFSPSADGGKMLLQSQGGWSVVDSAAPPKPGDGKLATEGMRTRVEPEAEWRQMFREAWRFQRDFLYVPNLHGADWDGIYGLYEPLVQHVRHRSDLTYLMDMVGGEVGVGHSFTGGGDNPDVEEVSVGLLGADLEIHKGRYRIARIYTGENWDPDLQAPLSAPGVDVKVGDYLIRVNGRELTAADNPYSLFEGTAGRQTALAVSEQADGDKSREVTVVPVAGDWALRRKAWVEDNRRKVDEMSGGRLAYVYLPNTAGQGYTFFNRYYFSQQDRDGVILDERFNGGGSAADYMIDVMRRKLYGFFNNPARDRKPDTSPGAGIWGPKVMVINESAGSGGDYLPYMFKAAGLGPLVGTRTWGGLVGIWDTPPLLDGGFITAPRGGFFDTAGRWKVENEGVAPDIEVEQWPKDVAAGSDPQLERAVAEAMRLLKNWKDPRIAEPAPPERVQPRRP